ncbi:multiple epidermal growth factor-like domains protein 10 [Gigantopelta aegis]|uniref:multiple epidermal growth factor-like domains protein 10 n=1 Tax=Gigantopelta aegis TaxID=1735272 RepID=UPI001B88D1E9|nr:multiple epidermal growth factor-like domains protein 10 [Gigantopelta aegis]XP_041361331.1 multiple epidermal growth factor-like domains protein 10 [Gigantopelta aegis]
MLSLLVPAVLLLLCLQNGVTFTCTDYTDLCSHSACYDRHLMYCMKTCRICTDTDCVEGYFRTQNPHEPCRPCEEATVEDKTKGIFENYCPQCQTNGRHGQDCKHNCSEGCVQKKCDRWTGVCERCKTGYYGSKCFKCGHCDVCDEQGVCSGSCHQGWFGIFCKDNCYVKCNKCDRSTGQCYQCAVGYSGTYCTEPCPTTCRIISCQQDGTCPEGCKDGFYGDKCSKTCSTNCLNKRCHQGNGSCADGYLLRYLGEKFDITCHGMCLGNSCDSPMGKCKEGCSKSDVYGPFCNYTCNGNCESVRCQSDESGNVLCSAVCIRGKMGDHCTEDCPAYCHGSCDQTSGRCLKLCRSRNDCSERCPVNCLTDNCLQDNGTCTHGCKPSFYGAPCSKLCSNNCRKSNCHMDPGLTCVDGCVGGWRGNYCEQKCQDICSVCDQNSGRCSGCLEGLYGDNCDSLCADGCPVCNQVSGTCMAPRDEDQRKNIDGMYMNITKPNFVLLSLIVLVIIMILLEVIVHVIRRRPISEKLSSGSHSLTTIHSSSHSYDTIDDSRSATDYQTIPMSTESSMASLQIPPLAEVFDDVEERQWLKCNSHATDGSERSTSSLYLFIQPDEPL